MTMPTPGITRSLSSHEADLDAHIKDRWEVWRTGEYYSSFAFFPSNAALVANTLYALPIVIPRDMTVDRIMVEVSVAVAATNIRLGIYNDGTNLYPGTLLLDAGTVSSATTGVKAITISKALTKGIYHLAYVSDGAPSIYGANQGYQYHSPLGINPTDTDLGYNGWNVAFTYAALPDPFTADGTIKTANFGGIAVRVLSLD